MSPMAIWALLCFGLAFICSVRVLTDSEHHNKSHVSKGGCVLIAFTLAAIVFSVGVAVVEVAHVLFA